MSWQPRKPKWPWRDFLTNEERAIVTKAETAKANWLASKDEWLRHKDKMDMIRNRAIHRAMKKGDR